MHSNKAVQRFGRKEMPAVQDDDRRAIQVNVAIVFELQYVDPVVLLVRADTAEVWRRTSLTAQAWTLMAAAELLRATTSAWETIAGSCAWQGTVPLMFAGPSAGLNAWGAGFVTCLVASRVYTPNLRLISTSLRLQVACVATAMMSLTVVDTAVMDSLTAVDGMEYTYLTRGMT
jgi:hypothetical protein